MAPKGGPLKNGANRAILDGDGKKVKRIKPTPTVKIKTGKRGGRGANLKQKG
jgi:hypothetical protein